MDPKRIIYYAQRHGVSRIPDNFWLMSPEDQQREADAILASAKASDSEQAKQFIAKVEDKPIMSPPKRRTAHAPGKSLAALPGEMAVVIPFHNPLGWKSKRKNFEQTYLAAKSQGADVWVVECTKRGEPPTFDFPQLLHMETDHTLWQKEPMVNLAVERLPDRYDKVAWIDCDCLFDFPDWVERTEDALDSHVTVQISDKLLWINEWGVPEPWHNGVLYYPSVASTLAEDFDSQVGGTCFPGLAWAARRDLLQQHHLYDRNVLGGGDTAWVYGCYGLTEERRYRYLVTEKSIDHVLHWVRALYCDVRGSVGIVRGVARHLFHGRRQDRQYTYRHSLLRDIDFAKDFVLNETGALEWAQHVREDVRRAIGNYYEERKEDFGEAATISAA